MKVTKLKTTKAVGRIPAGVEFEIGQNSRGEYYITSDSGLDLGGKRVAENVAAILQAERTA